MELLDKIVEFFANIIYAIRYRNNLGEATGEIKLGPISRKIYLDMAKHISFDSEIKNSFTVGEILPDIKLRVYGGKQGDAHSKLLKWKPVTIGLCGYEGNNYLEGKCSKITNSKGEVVFKGLKVTCSGRYKLIARAENAEASSPPFSVNAKASDTNLNSNNVGLSPKGIIKMEE